MSPQKRLLLATTALVMMGAGGQEAIAQVPPPAAGFTGFYFGGNLGYSWGRADVENIIAPFTQTAPYTFNFPGDIVTASLKPSGFVGGVQTGYNWSVARLWVFGVETDFQWTGQKDTGQGLVANTANCTFGTCNYNSLADVTAKLSWFGTVRGRFGPEWNNLWFYATGGLAYGHISVSGLNTLTDTTGGAQWLTPFSFSTTKTGWTFGGGIEGYLGTGAWRWKIEYLHIDLGSFSGGSFGNVPNVTVNVTKFTDDILRVGFNFALP